MLKTPEDRMYSNRPTMLEDNFRALGKQEIEVTVSQNKLINNNIVNLHRQIQDLTRKIQDQAKLTSKDLLELRSSLGVIHGRSMELSKWSTMEDERHSGLEGALQDHRVKIEKHREFSALHAEKTKLEIQRIDGVLASNHSALFEKADYEAKQRADRYKSLWDEFRGHGDRWTSDAENAGQSALEKHLGHEKKLEVLAKMIDDKFAVHGDLIQQAHCGHNGLVDRHKELLTISEERHMSVQMEMTEVSKTAMGTANCHAQASFERHGSLEFQLASLGSLHGKRLGEYEAELKVAKDVSASVTSGHIQKLEARHEDAHGRAGALDAMLGGVNSDIAEAIQQHLRESDGRHSDLHGKLDGLAKVMDESHGSLSAEIKGVSVKASLEAEQKAKMAGADLGVLQRKADARHSEQRSLLDKHESAQEQHKSALLDHASRHMEGHAGKHVARADDLKLTLDARHGEYNSYLDAQPGVREQQKQEILRHAAETAQEHNKAGAGRHDAFKLLVEDRHGAHRSEVGRLAAAHEEHAAEFDGFVVDCSMTLFKKMLADLRITMEG